MMRRHYLHWSIAVFGIIGTAYGTYLLIYHYNHSNKFSVPALLLLIFGLISLILALILYISTYMFNKKKEKELPLLIKEEINEKENMPVSNQEEKTNITPTNELKERQEIKIEKAPYHTSRTKESYSSPSRYSFSTVYVKKIGYGPVLRVEGNRIIDMRTNTYYRIENNMVMQDGYGPIYEIRGNQIKDAFGGYLYELSGGSINKVFGGYFASLSGNYISTYDLSQKYELTDQLSRKQILVVAALLFGKY